MTVVCKLCGVIIKDPQAMNEHRRNHHGWVMSFDNHEGNIVEW
jgi:hypothetical protein